MLIIFKIVWIGNIFISLQTFKIIFFIILHNWNQMITTGMYRLTYSGYCLIRSYLFGNPHEMADEALWALMCRFVVNFSTKKAHKWQKKFCSDSKKIICFLGVFFSVTFFISTKPPLMKNIKTIDTKGFTKYNKEVYFDS